jgi:hypothetical protein
MDLEWDEEKRRWTLEQRGLDFADVLEFDPASIQMRRDGRADYGELRFNVIGLLRGTLCTYCWTPREGRMRVM